MKAQPMRAVGYCRVSTDDQGESGLGLEAQRATITAEVERRGWTLETILTDVASGKSLRRRANLQVALTMLADGSADVLVVGKLDRLSRSVGDFAAILARSTAEGWALDVCDLGVDTTTASGKMVAQIMMVLAEWEREMIAERTRAALGAARKRGTKLGRPRGVAEDTLRLIRILRDGGRAYHAIAATLNAENVPTGQGGRWYAATVKLLYVRETTAPEMQEPAPPPKG